MKHTLLCITNITSDCPGPLIIAHVYKNIQKCSFNYLVFFIYLLKESKLKESQKYTFDIAITAVGGFNWCTPVFLVFLTIQHIFITSVEDTDWFKLFRFALLRNLRRCVVFL